MRTQIIRYVFFSVLITLLLAVGLAACNAHNEPQTLRLATTTSTYDSGLLDAILPAFEEESGVHVDVVAVGTGQALAIGAARDADVLLVHAPELEKAFVADGNGLARYPVMFNDFVIVGPPADPAGIAALGSAAAALSAIAASGAEWASRGDESGTHVKERSLWTAAGLAPDPAVDGWYRALGQGMGATLQFAHERNAYTLTDRGTFLAQQNNLQNLTILFGGDTIAANPDPSLRNNYSVIPVAPAAGADIDVAGAETFVAWLISLPVQRTIAQFGNAEFGQALFYPDSEPWRAEN